MGRKVNLGFFIIQHMAKVLTSSRSILPYGMLLTTIFQFFRVDLDNEVDIRMSKPSNNIDNACITSLGYEFNGRRWVEKARAHVVVDMDTDEEVGMDIPLLLPTTPPSPHSPSPAPSTVAVLSFALNWYHDLSQRIDTLNLDL